MYAHRLFCTKFNSEQPLFEQFFHIMRIFGSVQFESEPTFPLQYNIIFETYQSFEPSSTYPGGDRHVRSQTFLYEIQF